ncbi:MAG TPA: class I SAM-dependent methyltransferase [Candidatus Eisenbacteria bacterium]|nr:class I SAM-dependent methyltransferase [Candidatus Eisenbacteria bacterium]
MSPRLGSHLFSLLRAIRHRQWPIWIDYPPAPRPRWGHGLPAHGPLQRRLEEGRASYRGRLEEILAHRERLSAVPAHGRPESGDPYWINGFLPGLDAAALYGFVARHAPARYVEIGSGHSTRFAARAIRDHGLATRIVSFDPSPRASIQGLAHEFRRARLEDLAPGELAAAVAPGDILFLDGSHRALQNSDVTVFFLEVLPSLPPGVILQIHDICLPYDYPPGWEDRWYSEQYLLAAFLLGGGAGVRVLLPNAFVSFDPELSRILDPIWADPSHAAVERVGSSFWMETVGSP